MSEVQSKILSSLHDIFIDTIEGLNAKCFTGGSFRFGYHTKSSDVDIMVKDPGPTVKGEIIQALDLTPNRKSRILTEGPRPGYNNPDIESVFTYKNLVHVVFIYTDSYDQLAQDHVHLDLFYGKYPILIKFIPFLRKVGMDGGHIFRLMREFSMSKYS